MQNYCAFVFLLLTFTVTNLVAEKVEAVGESVKVSEIDDAVFENGTGRSILSKFLPVEVSLPFVIREIGMLECLGVDHVTGGKFFETLMGVRGADASGNYLCKPTCGGECVPNQERGVAPTSLYPFGCRCSRSRCDSNGPKVEPFGSQRFRIVCVPDTRCTCKGVGVPNPRGYLCNWINRNTSGAVSFFTRPPRPDMEPTRSPIRWCSCCPQVHVGPMLPAPPGMV